MAHVFIVENIKCGGCEATIVKSLKKIPQVTGVTVDITAGAITLIGEADAALIRHTLDHLGYPVQGHNSVMARAKSFVSCAIGRMARG